MKKVYFSPSDQTRNTYAAGNTNEAEQCRKIALACVKAAKRCGFEALTDAEAGGDYAMEHRIEQSNEWGADVHIPIHTNAFNGNVAGTRMFCFSIPGDGYNICKAIMETLAPITPGGSDSITEKHWDEVVLANAPTAYIEVGFHDNPTEARWIADHTEDIAEAIVKGLCNYYGVQYAAPSAQKPTDPVSSGTLYRVQVGAFGVKKNAESLRDKLKSAGYDAFIVDVQR